jgi:excisionase family DNA binding protein
MSTEIAKAGDFVTVNQAADAIGVSFMAIYKWIKAEKISWIKLGSVTFIPWTEVQRKKNEREKMKEAKLLNTSPPPKE